MGDSEKQGTAFHTQKVLALLCQQYLVTDLCHGCARGQILPDVSAQAGKAIAPRENAVLNKDENGKWALVQRLMEQEPGCLGHCSTGGRAASSLDSSESGQTVNTAEVFLQLSES